jgi:hypothetical protein
MRDTLQRSRVSQAHPSPHGLGASQFG